MKKECAPLIIQQKGCIPEKLLRCRDAHELISYSEGASETDIDAYLSVIECFETDGGVNYRSDRLI